MRDLHVVSSVFVMQVRISYRDFGRKTKYRIISLKGYPPCSDTAWLQDVVHIVN